MKREGFVELNEAVFERVDFERLEEQYLVTCLTFHSLNFAVEFTRYCAKCLRKCQEPHLKPQLHTLRYMLQLSREGVCMATNICVCHICCVPVMSKEAQLTVNGNAHLNDQNISKFIL